MHQTVRPALNLLEHALLASHLSHLALASVSVNLLRRFRTIYAPLYTIALQATTTLATTLVRLVSQIVSTAAPLQASALSVQPATPFQAVIVSLLMSQQQESSS